MCVQYGLKQLIEGGRLLRLERELTGRPCPVHGWLPGSAQSGTNELFRKWNCPPPPCDMDWPVPDCDPLPCDEEGKDQEGK
jgi:hypothetical protein